MSWVSADLDQDLRLAHGLDDLADVAPRLEQELELLAEQAHAAVQLVALRLQAPDLAASVGPERLHGSCLLSE